MCDWNRRVYSLVCLHQTHNAFRSAFEGKRLPSNGIRSSPPERNPFLWKPTPLSRLLDERTSTSFQVLITSIVRLTTDPCLTRSRHAGEYPRTFIIPHSRNGAAEPALVVQMARSPSPRSFPAIFLTFFSRPTQVRARYQLLIGSIAALHRSSHCESQRHMSPPLARFNVPFVAESGRRAYWVVDESWITGFPAAHCYAAQAFMIHRQLVGYATHKPMMLLVPPRLLPRPCQYDLDAGLEWYCVKCGRRFLLIQSDCPTSPLKSYHSSPCFGRLGIGLPHQRNECTWTLTQMRL